MSGDLLHTKLLMPPLRPSLVARPSLMEKLNRGLSGRLTLVAAPAGFGKTTLVANWLSQVIPDSAYPIGNCAWLSLDEYDDDPNRFWWYVFNAMGRAVPDIGAANNPLLRANPLPGPPALLTGLINALIALPSSVALVLDDYHVIGNRAIHRGVSFLLENGPPQLHCVLITRADPPLAKARLRAEGALNEIRVADLRFTKAEAANLLCDVMSLPLTRDDVASLEIHTEGWITGLQLVAAALQTSTNPSEFIDRFTGSHRYILEYLTEEVLLKQPDTVQAFLLKTSILPRLSGPLCDAVTGRDDSRLLLERLSRDDLFVAPLDDGRLWFRYHRLLADSLGKRLEQLFPDDEIRTLHRRASRWFEENGEWEAAVFHATESSDWERAATLVAGSYDSLHSEGRIATWQRWLAKIPAHEVRKWPELIVRQGWSAFLNGRIKEAEVTLQASRKTLQSAAFSPKYDALRGELATYLATIACFQRDPAAIIKAAEEALAYLRQEDLVSRVRATLALGLGLGLAGESRQALALYEKAAGLARKSDHVFLLAHALETVADGQRHMGRLQAARATCREIIALAENDRTTPLPFAGNAHIKLAAINIELNEVGRARSHLERGLALSQQGGIGYTQFEAHCIEASLRRATGDHAAALASLQRAETIFRESQSEPLAIQLSTAYVQHWLDAQDVTRAAAWAEYHPLTGEPIRLEELPVTGQELHQLTLARVRLAQGRPDAVLALFDRVHDQAKAAGRNAWVVEISLFRALALQAKGELSAALETLRPVLAMARPEGLVKVFVECGQDMRALLARLREDERDDYVIRLLNAFPRPSLPAPNPQPAGMADPLSPRELDVLRLIAAGLSNKQIAAELTLTLHTVKKHSSHIYGKLGVAGRTQAIVRANELGLL